jgi:hypothetical protein
MVAEAQHREVEGSDAGLTREQLVEQIGELNPTASVEFLAGFEPSQLRRYLCHLLATQEPRGRTARWTREHETPAITRWVPA